MRAVQGGVFSCRERFLAENTNFRNWVFTSSHCHFAFMVQRGARWCSMVQGGANFLLRSKIVADMLLKISGIQMSNKMGAKRPK